VIVVNCNKHPGELLKFIDVASSTFGPHCDLCLVDPNNDFRNMKIERVVDLQDKVRGMIMK